MSGFHQVVFTGELRPGVNAEQAARDFAAVFKIPQEKAWRLILDKREHVLKHEVNDVNAERYREVLEEIGLAVRIEPAGTPLGRDGAADELPGSVAPAGAGADATQAAPGATAPHADPSNPYAPPRADLRPPVTDEEGPMTGPQSVPTGHGWLWIKDAYALFRAKPRAWLGAIVTLYLINFVVGLVPVVGGLVGFVLGPIFGGGLMSGARDLDRRGTARSGMVFDGFSGPALQLALLGLLYLAGFLVAAMGAGIVMLAGGALSAGSLGSLSLSDPQAVAAALPASAAALMLLTFLALVVPVLMAYWFAPALVMLEGMSAVEAMQTSFRGCWKNMLPFLVYGLAMLGILLVFSLAVGLLAGLAAAALGPMAPYAGLIGIVLAVPVLLAFAAVGFVSQYTGYRDIFRHIG
ncbi:MAG: hypothetical protein LJE69_12120 [Thiohalocapsa sp.]|jgi:uncharacterized membrane protein|uniref:BPSS1780 family membrane protein n=1 Tax=Thiohalocapsa sp. TaxID=2497641 RepID=UPI0025F3D4F7|nr:BPSS1780 family membrane protein [Thiohalocapsa sp.]MCG6941982.1 hypothetical protein [Thiohalocapsa sp.]